MVTVVNEMPFFASAISESDDNTLCYGTQVRKDVSLICV